MRTHSEFSNLDAALAERNSGAGWPDASDSPWVRCTVVPANWPDSQVTATVARKVTRLSEGNPVHCGSSGATVAPNHISEHEQSGLDSGSTRPYTVAGERATVAGLGISPYAMKPMAIK